VAPGQTQIFFNKGRQPYELGYTFQVTAEVMQSRLRGPRALHGDHAGEAKPQCRPAAEARA